MNLTDYVLDRTLCTRCGNEGTLKHEGKYEGCPDCPRGQEVNRQLAEIKTEQDRTNADHDESDEPYGFCFLHGEEWGKGGGCEGCSDENRDTRRAAYAERRAAS
jgi:hypothetical protein